MTADDWETVLISKDICDPVNRFVPFRSVSFNFILIRFALFYFVVCFSAKDLTHIDEQDMSTTGNLVRQYTV